MAKRNFYKRNFPTGEDLRDVRKLENLKEVDVGITAYIGDTQPFNGILKAKYSDFHVNEIDDDGHVVTLTSLAVPEPPKDELEVVVADTSNPQIVAEGLISEQEWIEVGHLVTNQDNSASVLIKVTAMAKNKRTEIHNTVKAVYNQKVVSTTYNEGSEKYIKISLFDKQGNFQV